MTTHTPPNTHTTTQKLASLLLGKDVLEWAAALRGRGASYEEVARQLARDTDEQVVVTGEAVRRWFVDAEAAQ